MHPTRLPQAGTPSLPALCLFSASQGRSPRSHSCCSPTTSVCLTTSATEAGNMLSAGRTGKPTTDKSTSFTELWEQRFYFLVG